MPDHETGILNGLAYFHIDVGVMIPIRTGRKRKIAVFQGYAGLPAPGQVASVARKIGMGKEDNKTNVLSTS
ncbi:MAG: hypothetical protein WCI20_09470 [bacterium]